MYSMKEFEKAFGDYIKGFKDQFVPHTRACLDFKQRELKDSAVYAQGRLVDDAEGMIAEWRKNDNNEKSTKLPIMIVGMGRDYTPSTGDYARIRGDAITVQLPHSDKFHEMRAMVADRKVQVLVVASNEPTARNISAQFALWVSAFENRRIYPKYELDGVFYKFPAVIEDPNVMVSNVDSGQKNLVMMTIDLNFREQFPLVYAESEKIKEIVETNIPTEFKRKIDKDGVTRL